MPALHLFAQQFGGNPPSLKWKQINNDTSRIIFPAGLESQAQQVSSIVQVLSQSTLSTIGNKQKKINIVFQNQTTISNAYVGLAPFRSEFLLTPDQNSFELGSLPWQQQLAIHEYRHVEQDNNFRVGLSKIFFYLFGEGGQAFANSLSVPNWFYEGDAVYQETLVSGQGRGRLPYFFNGYRSLWAADKNYSYMKLRNGSLRDYTPDHYPLGYMLVAYGREKYGDDFWRKVSHDAAAFRGLFYPMQKAIKKYSGASFSQFRAGAFHFFSDGIKEEAEGAFSVAYAPAQKHFVADEEFPQFIDEGNIVFARTTYKCPAAFVVRNLTTNEERKISIKSVSINNYFSYKNDKIVYAAFEPDLRWAWRDYSIIKELDVITGKEKSITSHSKYFSPDISDDGKGIVAVKQSVDGSSSLDILNAETGEIEREIPNRDGLYYAQPKFYDENLIAVAVRNSRGEMSLALVNINDGSCQYLVPFSMNVIGFPSVKNNIVYFSASHNGQDQLFAATKNQLYKMELPDKNQATGSYQLQASKNKYVWTEFTAVGYNVVLASKGAVDLREITPSEFLAPLTVQGIYSIGKSTISGLLHGVRAGHEPVTRYSQSFDLLNFHSWRPYITDPDYMLSLESENILNTAQSDIYFDYNRNEGYKQVGADVTYGQLFPWVNIGGDYTFGRNDYFRGRIVYWNEAQAKAGLSVPLNLSKGKHLTNLQIGNEMVYNQRYYQDNYKDTFDHRGYIYTLAYLNFTNQTQQARMQIYPGFAQTLYLNYYRAVSIFEGNQFLASSYFYFPGFSETNSLVLSAAFQQHDSLREISFSNSFPFSRGYSAENFYRMFRLGANYHFPLAYPDWGFGNIIYFLRIRANLFFDYTKVCDFYTNSSRFNAQYKSFGTEIFFDTKWWNQLPVSFGFRYAHLLDNDFLGRGPNQWEFILPINLLSR
ncbi:MAG: hypothetical protein JST47_08265 [Bacteroidetes bacterium]|nr:hypothetical protein [Bacteroidota bacterium]